MSRILIALFAIFVTISSSYAHKSAIPSEPFTIQDDWGGDIDEFSKWYRRLLQSGTPVKIDGWCVSACTLVLMLPKEQVCVTPRASFGFHLAANDRGKPDPELTDMLIKRFYPDIVQLWLDTRRPITPRVMYMHSDQIVAFQIFDECK